MGDRQFFWPQGIFFFACARAHARSKARRSFAPLVVLLFAAFVLPVFAAPLSIEQAKLRLNDPKSDARIEGILALKTYRQIESAQALQAALAIETDPQVQLALLDGIGVMPELVSARALNPLVTHTLVPIRMRAIYILGLIGGRPAERILSQVILRETDSDVKAMALQSLSLCGSSESVDEIQKALYDKRPAVRAKAAESLRHIPGKASEKTLEAALSDSDPKVRDIAQKALAKRKAKGKK